MVVQQSELGNDFLYVLDNDETIDSNDKTSIVKVFELSSSLIQAKH